MTTTDTTTQTPEATVTPITPGTPVRATWKQHGNPISGFEFYGTAVKAPAAKGLKVAKVESDPQGISLKNRSGKLVHEDARFGSATKFWAVVPADAPRKPVAEPKAKGETAAPIEITAPKGGDTFVPPIKGAIAAAIKNSGESIQAISRKHGLNPSQMRRLAADSVAKVDTVRAQAIAKALGVKVENLFGKAETKATAAPKTPKATGSGNRNDGASRQTKATKAAAKAAKEQADREAAEAAEAVAAQAAAEGTQADPTPETPAE